MKKSIFALTISSLFTIALVACGDSGTGAADDSNISWKKGGDGKFYKTGSMVDPRDGKTYKTVKIGDQVWMAENLAFYDTLGIPQLTSAPTTDQFYWPTELMPVAIADDESQDSEPLPVQEPAGRTYTYDAAMNFGYFSDTSYNDGICPPGWHLPIMAEFDILKSNILLMCDSTAPCSKLDDGWKGSETLWTSTPANGVRINSTYGYSYRSNSSDAVSYTVNVEDFSLFGADFSGKSSSLNVRCVQGAAADSLVALESYNQTREKNIEEKHAADSALQYMQNGAKNYFNENLNYGYFTDLRDSNVYGYLKVGSYIWMAENLRYTTASSYCNSYIQCEAKTYQDSLKYYNVGLTYVSSEKDTVCPDGWHLPSKAEWLDLRAASEKSGDFLGDDGLWEFSSTELTNSTGFTVLTATVSNGKRERSPYNQALFWIAEDSVVVRVKIDTVFVEDSTEVDSLEVPARNFTLDTVRTEDHYYLYYKFYWMREDFVIEWTSSSYESFSVRCVKDY